jgi:hypothetical protein
MRRTEHTSSDREKIRQIESKFEMSQAESLYRYYTELTYGPVPFVDLAWVRRTANAYGIVMWWNGKRIYPQATQQKKMRLRTTRQPLEVIRGGAA